MKRSELTNQQKLLVPCPICGAAIGVHCKMYSGLGRRNEAHAERKYQAVQFQAISEPENILVSNFISAVVRQLDRKRSELPISKVPSRIELNPLN